MAPFLASPPIEPPPGPIRLPTGRPRRRFLRGHKEDSPAIGTPSPLARAPACPHRTRRKTPFVLVSGAHEAVEAKRAAAGRFGPDWPLERLIFACVWWADDGACVSVSPKVVSAPCARSRSSSSLPLDACMGRRTKFGGRGRSRTLADGPTRAPPRLLPSESGVVVRIHLRARARLRSP